MYGSRSVFLNAQSARFIFGYDDSSGANSRKIVIAGHADQSNARGIAGTHFLLTIQEVTDDFKYDKIKNPDEEYKDEESSCYGNAILQKLDEHLEKETLYVDLLLTPEEFSRLKDILDKFFAGTVGLVAGIQMIGMELGHEPWLDKCPSKRNLPVVGYTFIAHSKEMDT